MSDEKSNGTEQDTNRTSEQFVVHLRSATAKRLAAIFLGNPHLTLKQIYKILRDSEFPPSFTESALRGVLARWRKRGLLFTDGYFYNLNPIWGTQALIVALGGEDSVREQGILDSISNIKTAPRQVTLELIPRWWSEVFDISAAWRERSVVRTKFDIYIANTVFELCEQKPKPQDRSGRHVHREKTFTIEVFPSGKVHIWTKNDPTWLDKLGRWLKKGGLGPSDLRLVASAIERKLTQSRSTLELPVKASPFPVDEWDLHIDYQGRTADLRLVRSHGGPPGEVEVRADERYLVDWLGMVTAASMTVMRDDERLEELEKRVRKQARQIQETLEEIDKYKKATEALVEEKERIEEERKKAKSDRPELI